MEQDEAPRGVTLEPGDYFFGGGRTRISTLLGSCISITFWHPELHIGGMCHYMLPGRRRPAGAGPDGRYADEAIEALLAGIAAAGTKPRDYQAKLFGGGAMFDGTDGAMDIGRRNVERGRELLAACGVPVLAEHVGGSGRRKLHFELWNGHVWLAFPDGKDAITRNANE